MGVVRKVVAVLLALVLCAALMAVPASAAQANQDGLRVELTTDRETYAPGETVTAVLTVTNTGSEPVLDLILEILIPRNGRLLPGEERVLQAQSLEPGGVLELTVRFIVTEGTSAAAVIDQMAPENAGGAGIKSMSGCIPFVAVHEEEVQRNGWLGWLCAGALVLAVVGVCLFGRRFVSLMLCLTMVFGLFAGIPAEVNAAQARPNMIETETNISVNGQVMTVRGRVGYRLPEGTGSDPLTLQSDEVYFVAGNPSEVTFTVETTRLASEIVLYRNGEQVGVLTDDGTSGDAAAGDGVYSCTVRAAASAAGQEVYRVKAGRLSSNEVTLHYFEPLNEQTAAQAQEVYRSVNLDLQAIENSYRDASGFLSPGKTGAVMAEVSAYLARRSGTGDILLYEVDDTGAYIKLSSGLTMMYAPTLESVSAGGTGVSLTFAIYQPHPDVANAEMEEWVGTLAQECGTTQRSCNGSAVTLDQVKAFGRDQVIIWSGHGGYGPIVKSFLASGESFDWAAWWFDFDYYFDCIQDRIINRSTEKQSNLACFTHKFVTYYCGDLSNDLIILGSCHSGQNDKLANAFLAKGARTVVGFSQSVYTAYSDNVTKLTTGYMLFPNEQTGNYYTVSEALDRATAELGADDLIYARRFPEVFPELKSAAAKPVVFGDGSFRYRDGQMGTLLGRICDASDRTTPIAGASICVGWDNFAEWSASSDERGEYTIALPSFTYPVKVSAPGYLDFVDYATVTGGQNTYMETYLMVAQSDIAEGTASGIISNAVTGAGLGGVQIEVRTGWNNTSEGNILATAATDSNGQYSLHLPLGNYTLNLKKDGFIDSVVNIVVIGGDFGPQNGTMTPTMSSGEYRVVLSWDANPRDLDSHLVGEKSSGGLFHVYYADKTYREGDNALCVLDVDDTNGYGPETVTLQVSSSGKCRYYVHRYAGSGTMADSGAQVRVFRGDTQIAVFNVPTDQWDGSYWNVFSIEDGQIVVRNTLTARPEEY